MALTPDEQAELDRLKANEAQAQEADQGNEALGKVFAGAHAAANQPRPFSLYRTTVGGLRDAVQNTLDFVDEAGDALYKALPVGPVVVYGKAADNGYIGLKWGSDAQKALDHTGIANPLPHLQGEEQAGTAERLTRGLVSFM